MTANTGRDLANATIKIGDVMADDRLRIGGILYLEEKLGKGFEEIADDLTKVVDVENVNITAMIKRMTPFVTALILQRNPDMEEIEAERAVMQLELEEFTDVFGQVKLFKTAKNSKGQKTGMPKKRTRQPVKK